MGAGRGVLEGARVNPLGRREKTQQLNGGKDQGSIIMEITFPEPFFCFYHMLCCSPYKRPTSEMEQCLWQKQVHPEH